MNNTSTATDARLDDNVLIEKEVPGNSDRVQVVMRIPGVDVTIPFPSPNQPGVFFKIVPLFKMTAETGEFSVIVYEDGKRISEAQFVAWRAPSTSFVMDVRHPITSVLLASYRVTNARPV
jgi:hypothetical protein